MTKTVNIVSLVDIWSYSLSIEYYYDFWVNRRDIPHKIFMHPNRTLTISAILLLMVSQHEHLNIKEKCFYRLFIAFWLLSFFALFAYRIRCANSIFLIFSSTLVLLLGGWGSHSTLHGAAARNPLHHRPRRAAALSRYRVPEQRSLRTFDANPSVPLHIPHLPINTKRPTPRPHQDRRREPARPPDGQSRVQDTPH